ncbi:MAG: hypothetical protein IPM69_06955 [Ignavibacteria bacterium]|nr:hypothetical protein [Ignavibacteria bacterium]
MSKNTIENTGLFSAIRHLIETSKHNVAVSVNAEMTLLYWNIGKRINDEILHNKRADYGKEIVVSLTRQLNEEFGTGWSDKQLRHCLRFAETFKDEVIVSALRRQFHVRSVVKTDRKQILIKRPHVEIVEVFAWNLSSALAIGIKV